MDVRYRFIEMAKEILLLIILIITKIYIFIYMYMKKKIKILLNFREVLVRYQNVERGGLYIFDVLAQRKVQIFVFRFQNVNNRIKRTYRELQLNVFIILLINFFFHLI